MFAVVRPAVCHSHRRSRGVQGVQVHGLGAMKKICRYFCWNEAKMGLKLVRCTPVDETKKVVGGSIGRIAI